MADLSIVLSIIGKDLASGALTDVTRTMHGLESKALTTNQAMLGVGAAMTAVGLAGATAFAGAISAAGDFEKTMSGVKAVMSPEEVNEFGKSLEDLALKLGKDTAFSAKEAAQGIEELVKGGVSATDILNGAADATLNLASAGGVGLKDAAEIASNALAMFNLKGEDMAHVADLIAGAANASSMDVMDFKFSLAQVGSMASTVGLSFDDTATAIALMAQAGVKGSDAGTAMKTALSFLIPKSKGAAAEMRALGLITEDGANQFFDAEGHLKSLAEMADVLAGAFGDLSEEQRLAALHTTFGTDAIKFIIPMMKAGGEGARGMADDLTKVTAAAVGAARMDNLNGSIEQLKGSFETLQITIGQRFLPLMREIVDRGTEVLNWFLELPEPVQNTGIAIAAVVTAVGLLGGPLLILAGALPTLAAGFALIAPAVLAVAAPVAALTVAIGLLAAAWVNDWGGMRTNLQAIWEDGLAPVFDAIGEVLGVVGSLVGELLGEWVSSWAGIGDASEEGGAQVGDASKVIIAWLRDDLTPRIRDFTEWWREHWDTIKTILTVAVDAMTLPIRAMIQFNQMLIDAWALLVPAISKAVGDILNWLGTLKDKMLDLFGKVGEAIPEGLKAGIASKWGELTTWMGTQLTDFLNSAKAVLGIHSPSQAFFDQVGVPIGQGIIEGATATIADGARQVLAQVTELMGQARQAISGGGAAYIGGGLGLPAGTVGGLGAITGTGLTGGTGAGGMTGVPSPRGGGTGSGGSNPPGGVTGGGLAAWGLNPPALSYPGIVSGTYPYNTTGQYPGSTIGGGGGGAAPTGPNPALWNPYAVPLPEGYTQEEWYQYLNGLGRFAPTTDARDSRPPVVINQTNNITGTSPAEFMDAADGWLDRAQWQAGIA